ncbi:hypothetical protein GGR55DRAFT_109427 [Xylaria sp. FL0064]|nr:hypothetical protein GGR55DRAFT_109427 [Xylaria sp. FL0064]
MRPRPCTLADHTPVNTAVILVCVHCFGSGAVAETRSSDLVFCFMCGARENRECFCCCCCCRRSECTLAPKHGLSHSHVSVVSTCRQRRRQPGTEAPPNMALNLRSSNCTLEECLEITASFPLLSRPTRHPPEGFVMDHSLLCSAAQAMAHCLSWSAIAVMSSSAFAIKMHHSPWLSVTVTHSKPLGNYTPLATATPLL